MVTEEGFYAKLCGHERNAANSKYTRRDSGNDKVLCRECNNKRALNCYYNKKNR